MMIQKKAVLIKFTEGDFAKLKQAAQERRLPMSAFIRMLVVRQLEVGGVHE